MPAAENMPSSISDGKVITSDELLAGQSEVVILHRGQPYRLRVTRQDKLILTK